jgi:hypothetical protein
VYRHARMTVVDRTALEALACNCYNVFRRQLQLGAHPVAGEMSRSGQSDAASTGY